MLLSDFVILQITLDVMGFFKKIYIYCSYSMSIKVLRFLTLSNARTDKNKDLLLRSY